MRSLTTAQLLEITSPAEVKLLINATGFQYVSTPDTGSYGFYDPLLGIEDWTQECDWIGGMSAISDLTITLNNSDNESDVLDSSFFENDEITVSILLNDTTLHTIYKGVITDWTINQDEWEVEIVDETTKFDVDVLVEITKTNYPDSWEESFGLFIPLLYCYTNGVNYPMINVRKTHSQLLFANHSIDAGSSINAYRIFSTQIEEYITIINAIQGSLNTSTTAYYSFWFAEGLLSQYKKYIPGETTTAGTADFEHLSDGDSDSEIELTENKVLTVVLDIADLGYIYDNSHVDMIILNNGRGATTPHVELYDIASSSEIGAVDINADSFTFTPDGPDDAGALWSFNNLKNSEWRIQTVASETITVQGIYFNIRFNLFGFAPQSQGGIRSSNRGQRKSKP